MTFDPDVPLLQRMVKRLRQAVKKGDYKPQEALQFLQGYAESLTRQSARSKIARHEKGEL